MKQEQFDRYRPEQMFRELVPTDVQRALCSAIRRGYSVAERHLSRYQVPEAADVRPMLRRACIEAELARLASRFPEDVLTVQLARNAGDNCSHRRVVCNQVLMQCCYVTARRTLPEGAAYRKGYAGRFQGEFPFVREADDPGELLYGVLTHAPSPADFGVPAFIDVVFPDRDYKHVLDVLPLHDAHLAALIPDGPPAAIEVVSVEVEPRLRARNARLREQA